VSNYDDTNDLISIKKQGADQNIFVP